LTKKYIKPTTNTATIASAINSVMGMPKIILGLYKTWMANAA
jgi:hypothetical protein